MDRNRRNLLRFSSNSISFILNFFTNHSYISTYQKPRKLSYHFIKNPTTKHPSSKKQKTQAILSVSSWISRQTKCLTYHKIKSKKFRHNLTKNNKHVPKQFKNETNTYKNQLIVVWEGGETQHTPEIPLPSYEVAKPKAVSSQSLILSVKNLAQLYSPAPTIFLNSVPPIKKSPHRPFS